MPEEKPSVSAAQHLQRRGIMLVLASPPGGGKTSVSRSLIERDKNTTISVSATTRAMRPGEVDGTHYHFISKDQFEQLIAKGDMLEHALVYNNYFYGTPKAPVEAALSQGKDVLFDIDWQGNRSLKQKQPSDVVSVFLLPPSWDELAHRLHNRAQDSEDEISRRLSKAQDEISHYAEFDYVIVNYDFEDTVAQVQAILQGERLKRDRQTGIAAFVETLKPR